MAPDDTGMGQDLSDGREFVRITNRQIYDALTQLERRVYGLENRVDNVLGENVELRKRVRALELRFYGIAAGLLAAVAILVRVGSIPGFN